MLTPIRLPPRYIKSHTETNRKHRNTNHRETVSRVSTPPISNTALTFVKTEPKRIQKITQSPNYNFTICPCSNNLTYFNNYR